MAWTKAKMAVATGGAVLVLAVGVYAAMNQVQNDSAPNPTVMKLPTGNVAPMVKFGYSGNGGFLASDGSLWSWGEQRFGWPALGLGNITKTTSLRRIGTDTNWAKIAVGDSYSLALKSDGTLWGWGENLYGQLGDRTKITRSTPIPSVPGNDWKEIAAGSASFAIKNDGTLWAWGNNWAGQLGLGDRRETSKPEQVGTSTNWTKIWAGTLQTVGLQSDGSLWFWGSTTGDGQKKGAYPVPTRVSPDTNWVDACFGYFTVFAIKSDGTLWCWGNKARFYAQTNGDLASPARVGTEQDWQSCSSMSGGFYQLLRKKDGTLWALDASEHRIVKEDSEYKPVAFKKINLDKDIVAYTSGFDDLGLAMTRDGEVWTWGRVLGGHGPEDFRSPEGRRMFPTYKVKKEPWPLSISDSER